MKKAKATFLLIAVLLIVSLTGCDAVKSALNNTEKKITTGSFTGTTYTNDFFDLTFEIPKDWTVASNEDIMLITNATNDMLGAENEDLSKRQALYLAYVMKYPVGTQDVFNANINIVTTNLGLAGLSMKNNKEFLQAAIDQIDQSLANTEMTCTFGEIASKDIGGADFAVVDSATTLGEMEFQQRLLCTYRNNYAILVSLTWMDDAQLDELQTILDSMSFKKQ